MAILKTIPLDRFDSTTDSYYCGEFNTLLAVAPNDEAVYMGNNAYDAGTLFPLEGKAPNVLAPTKGHRTAPVTKSLLTTRPSAFTSRGTYTTDYSANLSYTTTPVRWGSNTFEQNMSFTRNMDKSSRFAMGHFIPFQDSAGVDHYFYINSGRAPVGAIPYGTTVGTSFDLILAQGLSLDSPVASVSATIAAAGFQPTGATGAVYIRNGIMHPLYVDGTNRKLYCLATYDSNSSTATSDFNRFEAIIVISFTTVASGGSLTINATPVQLQTRQGILGSQGNPGLRMGIPRVHHYIGNTLSGDPCFMVRMENETVGFQNNLVATLPSYAGTVANYTKVGYPHFFTKVSKVDSTITDLTGDNNGLLFTALFATPDDFRRYTGNVMPSHFEPSPIAGEDNIFYAYSLVYSQVDGTLDKATFVRYKWNKNTDVFTLAVCTADTALATVYSDMFGTFATKALAGDTQRRHIAMGQEFSTNVILTKQGNDYYLSVLGCFGCPNAVGQNSSNRTKVLATYQLNAANMTALTLTGTQNVSDCLSYVSGNADNTELLLLNNTGCQILQFNAGAWVETFNSAGSYLAVGKDQQGRYWGISVNGSVATTAINSVAIETLTPSLPERVSVVFQSTTVNWTGVNATTNLVVNAFNVGGARVARNAILKINGSNAAFTSNGAKNLQVTTSNAADTLVSITVSGPGLLNVSASFEV